MLKFFTLCLCFFTIIKIGYTQKITGTITEKNGTILPHASIVIKGTASGTTANSKGVYTLQLKQGNYTLICQHIGHKSIEKKVQITNADIVLNFELENQDYNLTGVVVTTGREDPAYEIIRKTIKKREEHLNEIRKFECEVYLKGQLQLRNYPKKFMGQTVDFEDGDTSKKKMLFLSETIAKYAVEKPNDAKVEVISTRVSGNSDGFGFSSPQIFSFYENMISLGRGLNPRGFVSPIANNALNFYKYKFEGTFFENGREVSRIKVIPKRKYEPLFSGYISIIENEWRIQSTELYLLKEQQMQLLDTLHIQQLYVPLKNTWVIKQQVILPAGKILGFDFFGSFVQVYDQFNIEPAFKKKFFDNVIIKVNDSANKKSKEYWDDVRPIPLSESEEKDYKKKDSLEQVRKDPKYLDSIDRIRNKFTLTGLLLTGKTFSNQKQKSSITIEPLMSTINYNTVEGIAINFSPEYRKRFSGRKSLLISPYIRYGFSNKHFNAHITSNINFGKKYLNTISISGGKRVFQINNEQPITERNNSWATLQFARNYLKIYEAWFSRIRYTAGIGNGISLFASFQYQDRLPLENLSDPTKWRDYKGRIFTPNYPTEIIANNFKSHKASIFSIGATWRPGTKYIELPDRKISLGSKYPTFTTSLTQGIPNFLSSDVDFAKWNFSISDNLNLKLGGRFSYKATIGGFINDKAVFIQDYQHYIGNQTVEASSYLNSFQLAPYYQYSNTAPFFTTVHAEYHLNGLLTNKLPLLKKWNWFFVVGGNALHINKNEHYYEAMFGIENIFKIIRVDYVHGFLANGSTTSGIRIAIPGLMSSKRDD
ncbi:MAG: carboxypeptidase-like regulatory domain-containing protein [Chitinophagaceae bacterium]|nr:carboxypeptidase-like regulatory domain-containing protein [Chitinophagaceae bacterium]